MLSSLDEELKTTQGEIEPEEQPSETVGGTRRQPVENSSARATKYAEVQSAVLAYKIQNLMEEYPSLMPNLNITADVSYSAGFEDDYE